MGNEPSDILAETLLLDLKAGRQGICTCDWTEGSGLFPKGDGLILKKVTCQGSDHWLAAECILRCSASKRDNVKDGSAGLACGAVFSFALAKRAYSDEKSKQEKSPS